MAPPEPPSPMMVATKGTGASRQASIERAMASAWPRASASMPGKAPAVSTKVRIGRLKRLASSMMRRALR